MQLQDMELPLDSCKSSPAVCQSKCEGNSIQLTASPPVVLRGVICVSS